MTTGFVLSGGGSLGAIQVGMLQAMADLQIKPDLLVGTSAGALNASYIAGHGTEPSSLKGLVSVWRGLRTSILFRPDPLRLSLALIGRDEALFSATNLRRLIKKHLTFTNLEDSPIPLWVVTTDLLTGLEVHHDSGPALELITASAAIPGIFAPVKYEPPPPKPRSPWGMIAGVAVVVVVGAAVLAFFLARAPGPTSLVARLAETDGVESLDELAPAAVRVGEPIPWREVAYYDWVVNPDHPRPAVVVGDFDSDGQDEIFQLDPRADTEIIELDGSSQVVQKADWGIMSRFLAWDMDHNGVAELVPETFVFAFKPTPTGYATIKLKGG